MKIWGEKGEKCQRRIHELLQGGEVMKVKPLGGVLAQFEALGSTCSTCHQGTTQGTEKWQGTLAGEVSLRGHPQTWGLTSRDMEGT